MIFRRGQKKTLFSRVLRDSTPRFVRPSVGRLVGRLIGRSVTKQFKGRFTVFYDNLNDFECS